MVEDAWVPVTDLKDLPSNNVLNGLDVRDTLFGVGTVSDPSNSSLPFLEQEMETKAEEPLEVIVSRVVYALLISASLHSIYEISYSYQLRLLPDIRLFFLLWNFSPFSLSTSQNSRNSMNE